MWILQPLLVGLVVLGIQGQPIHGGVPMPGPGGDTSGTGGSIPDVGGNVPDVGGPMPGLGGDMSGTESPMHDIFTNLPYVGVSMPGVGVGDPLTGQGGNKPVAGSDMSGTGGPMPGLGDPKPRLIDRVPETGDPSVDGTMPGVGGGRPGLEGEFGGFRGLGGGRPGLEGELGGFGGVGGGRPGLSGLEGQGNPSSAECPHEAIPNDLYSYKILKGGHRMKCPEGTFFNQSECRCSFDHDYYARLYPKGTGASCDIAVHVKFPNLTNLGVAPAAIRMIGDFGQGERGVGYMQTQWAGVNIPFYGGQELSSFYLEMTFTPTGYSRLPQVLLSSCSYTTYPDKWVRPSLEVSILPPGDTANIISVGVANKQGTTNVAHGLLFQLNATYTLRVIYDGKVVGIFMNPMGVPAEVTRHELRGLVPIHESGLRFSHCRNGKDFARFIGTVDEIMFSKCIDDKMKSMLHPAAAAPGIP